MNDKKWPRTHSLILLSLLAACSSSYSQALPTIQIAVISETSLPSQAKESSQLGIEEAIVPYGLSYQNPDGNRYVPGQLNMPAITPLDIPLEGKPIWVVGIGLAVGESVWLAALEDGDIQVFHVNGRSVIELTNFPQSTSAGTPPSLSILDSELVLLNDLAADTSLFSHPVLLNNETIAYIAQDGDLNTNNKSNELSISVEALHDGRLLSNSAGQLLFLSNPSTVYDHGIMGDAIEAQGITLTNLSVDGQADQIITLTGQTVIEGISAIWADLDADGIREIIVTQSNAQLGAQIVVYDNHGQQVASSATIGQGYRWRRQIAVAPFGPNGELELADVLTPHIGGIVEFFKLNNDTLDLLAQVPGYTSHVIFSRNLDMALAMDADADGRVELVLPNQSLNTLAAIQRTAQGAEVDWELGLDDLVSSNIASARFSNGTIAIGLGLESGLLRLWLP